MLEICVGRRTCTGLAPAATIFMPSAMMAADRMVAVVVPSPAVSLVLAAACARVQIESLRNSVKLVAVELMVAVLVPSLAVSWSWPSPAQAPHVALGTVHLWCWC